MVMQKRQGSGYLLLKGSLGPYGTGAETPHCSTTAEGSLPHRQLLLLTAQLRDEEKVKMVCDDGASVSASVLPMNTQD